MGFFVNLFHREGGKPGPSEVDDLMGWKPQKTGLADLKPRSVPVVPAPPSVAPKPAGPSLTEKLADRDSLQAAVSVAENEQMTAESARATKDGRYPHYVPTQRTVEAVHHVVELDSDPEVRKHDQGIEDAQTVTRVAVDQLKQGRESAATQEWSSTASKVVRGWLDEDKAGSSERKSPVGSAAAILAELDRLATAYGAPKPSNEAEDKPRSQPAASSGGGINMNSEIDNW